MLILKPFIALHIQAVSSTTLMSDRRRGSLKKRLAIDAEAYSSSNPCPSTAESRSLRQRTCTSESNAHPQPDAPFNLCMRRDWAKGALGANKVLEYTAAASKQGAEGVIKVREKWHAKTAHRDLVRALGWPQGVPDLKWIDIPFGPESIVRTHPIVCPVAFFSTVQREFPEMWKRRLQGPPGASASFWNSLRGHPLFEKNPDVSTPAGFVKTLALGLHGDAAPITKHESLLTIAWNSLHVEGTTMQTRFIFTCIRKSDIGPETLNAVWGYLAWAMNVLAAGLTPTSDFLNSPLQGGGKPLAGGWRASCVQIRGDWEFFAQALSLPRWDTDNCCWLCAASTSGPLLWTDCSPNAAWRVTMKTHEQFVQSLHASRKPLPRLFEIKGLRLEGVMVDTLHTVDQGVAVHAIANVFVEIMALGIWGSTQQIQSEGLQREIDAWYRGQSKKIKASKVQGRLLYERIKTTSDWPKLKAKAAATRHLSRFALVLAEQHNSGSLHDRRRLAVMQLLVEFYDIVEEGDEQLPPPPSAQSVARNRRDFHELLCRFE